LKEQRHAPSYYLSTSTQGNTQIENMESFEFSYSENPTFPYSNGTLEYNNTKSLNDNNETYHLAAVVALLVEASQESYLYQPL
jgi:hypothetical protein